eukprot:gene11882-biopygen10945
MRHAAWGISKGSWGRSRVQLRISVSSHEANGSPEVGRQRGRKPPHHEALVLWRGYGGACTGVRWPRRIPAAAAAGAAPCLRGGRHRSALSGAGGGGTPCWRFLTGDKRWIRSEFPGETERTFENHGGFRGGLWIYPSPRPPPPARILDLNRAGDGGGRGGFGIPKSAGL